MLLFTALFAISAASASTSAAELMSTGLYKLQEAAAANAMFDHEDCLDYCNSVGFDRDSAVLQEICPKAEGMELATEVVKRVVKHVEATAVNAKFDHKGCLDFCSSAGFASDSATFMDEICPKSEDMQLVKDVVQKVVEHVSSELSFVDLTIESETEDPIKEFIDLAFETKAQVVKNIMNDDQEHAEQKMAWIDCLVKEQKVNEGEITMSAQEEIVCANAHADLKPAYETNRDATREILAFLDCYADNRYFKDQIGAKQEWKNSQKQNPMHNMDELNIAVTERMLSAEQMMSGSMGFVVHPVSIEDVMTCTATVEYEYILRHLLEALTKMTGVNADTILTQEQCLYFAKRMSFLKYMEEMFCHDLTTSQLTLLDFVLDDTKNMVAKVPLEKLVGTIKILHTLPIEGLEIMFKAVSTTELSQLIQTIVEQDGPRFLAFYTDMDKYLYYVVVDVLREKAQGHNTAIDLNTPGRWMRKNPDVLVRALCQMKMPLATDTFKQNYSNEYFTKFCPGDDCDLTNFLAKYPCMTYSDSGEHDRKN